MSTKISPLYAPYFAGASSPADWTDFKSQKEDFTAPLSTRPVDFAIQDATLLDLAKSVWKVFIYTITLRYLLQRLVMIPLYPAQSRIVKFFDRSMQTKTLNELRQLAAGQKGRIVRDIVLEKNGVRYSGMLIGYPDIINNGQWVCQATGNYVPIEYAMDDAAFQYKERQYNTLLINGPSVGKSQGEAHPESMGEAQDLGILFLETALKAKKIAIAGDSIGGAAVGQAILKHVFQKDIKYLVIRQMTFDWTSNICQKIVGQYLSPYLGWVVAKLIPLIGLEMDSVAASKRLQGLGIKEIIIQAGRKDMGPETLPSLDDFISDDVIHPHASLGYALIKEGITTNKVFLCLKNAGHCGAKGFEAAAKQLLSL